MKVILIHPFLLIKFNESLIWQNFNLEFKPNLIYIDLIAIIFSSNTSLWFDLLFILVLYE
jgi:uncharacterized membrane protein